MVVQLQVPDDIAEKLVEKWSDLPRCALDALAVGAYREGVLTAYEVQRLLGLSSRWRTEVFLKRSGADLGYTEEDLREDAATLRRVLSEQRRPEAPASGSRREGGHLAGRAAEYGSAARSEEPHPQICTGAST